MTTAYQGGKESRFTIAFFRWMVRLVFISAILVSAYWLVIASDRYVSEANVFIQKTDPSTGQTFDVSMLVSGIAGASRTDQLLLREYLLSVDMLKKLDAAMDLRSHYSDRRRDPVSRMWSQDASIEWFHRHYLSRIKVEFDDFTGVVRITVQAYDSKTAQAIAKMMVEEGERFMNQIGHELANAQVSFLIDLAALAQSRFQQARDSLLNFQNKKGLVSPQATTESISVIIARLEEQKSTMQTQLASLPATLVPDHPNILRLKKVIEAVERQIRQERAKLTSTAGQSLNYTVDEFSRMQMEENFTQDIYKTALVGLEKGRMDATRTLKKVSVLQSPLLPEYPMVPRRLYNTVVTLLFAALLAGTVKLLESIVLDHVD